MLGPIIDVAIGLILVFLLLGLITSALQEVLAGWLQSRGKQLYDAIADLLAHDNGDATIFNQVFGHALVQGASATDRPSYVSSRNFTLALLDVLGNGSQAEPFAQVEQSVAKLAPGQLKQTLTTLIKDAEGDIDTLKQSIASWYDGAMDRLSGVYKRYTQGIALVIGLVLAISLNVDTIRIAESLWADSGLRASVVDVAQKVEADKQTANSTNAAQVLQNSSQQLMGLDLPIGWLNYGYCAAAPPARQKGSNAISAGFANVWGYFRACGWSGFPLILLGWVMTALATSLGAPFWFDMLGKFLNIRAAGPKPARADDSDNNSN